MHYKVKGKSKPCSGSFAVLVGRGIHLLSTGMHCQSIGRALVESTGGQTIQLSNPIHYSLDLLSIAGMAYLTETEVYYSVHR